MFGFTDAEGRPVSDGGVTTPRIWDYVGHSGGRSIVVNVPITYPPRPIEGVLVAGMPVPPGAPFTHPAELAARLEDDGYVPDVAVQEDPREGAATLARLARMTEARGRAVARLAMSEPWDLFAVVFVLPDRLGHPWWKQLIPGDHMYESNSAERVREQARDCLVALDRAVGELLEALPAGTSVVCCSDHGFGPLRADLFFDLVLARRGLIESPPGIRLGPALARLGRSRLGRAAPTALHRWLRAHATVTAESKRATAWTGAPYELGVRLADSEDVRLRDFVMDLLRELAAPDGTRVIRSVHPRAEIYHGPRVDEAPDVLCEMADESVGLHNGLHASRPWVSRATTAWGTHAAEGVIAISGAPAGAEVHGHAADVAPTVLALLGLEVGGLDGRSLVEPASRTTVVHGVSAGARPGEAPGVYTPDQEEAVLEHLRGLGYVD